MKFRSIGLLVVMALIASMVVLPVAGQDAPSLVIWADDTRAAAIQDIVATFTEEQGIEVEVVERPFDEIRDGFSTAAPAGEGADIIIGAHDWIGELVVNGLLAEIDLGDKAEDFVPAAVNAFNYEGTIYGVPYAMENVAFVRNTDLVPEAPATWEEVLTISEELVASGETDYGWIIQENDPYHFFPVQTAFGGFVFEFDEATGYDPSSVGIDSDGSIEALTFLSDYVEAGLMPTGLDYDTMHAAFEAGDAAMIITGPWAIERIQESGVPFEVSAIPGTEAAETGRPFLGVQGFMVNAFSDNQTIASLFLTEYIATEDVMQAIYESGNRPSAFIPVREGVEDEILNGFSAAGADGLAMPAIPEMSAVWSSWGNSIALVVQGEVDAETAFMDAAQAIRDTIAGES
jgi:arabinogalactan oligomer/maltooligosaccharide transport system substrate-binding protein